MQKNKIRFLQKTLAVALSTFLLTASACSQQTEPQKTANTAISPSDQPESEAAAVSPSNGVSETAQAESTEPVTDVPSAPAEMKQIGISQFAAHPSLDNCRKGFILGLQEGGYEEGKNINIVFENAQGDMSVVTSIAQKFLAAKFDVVCGIATPVVQGTATVLKGSGIPLVFNAVSDPIGAGLVESFDQPTDEITGVSDQLPIDRELELIRAMLPEAKTIGILYTSSEANSHTQLIQFQEAAPKYGFTIESVAITATADLPNAIDVLLPKVDCIQNLTDNTVVSGLPQILEKANAEKKPVFGSEEEQVVNGCLASEGIDYIQLGKQCGLQAAKILDGIPASQIPVETVSESQLTLNQTVADQLGIQISEEMLARARSIS